MSYDVVANQCHCGASLPHIRGSNYAFCMAPRPAAIKEHARRVIFRIVNNRLPCPSYPNCDCTCCEDRKDLTKLLTMIEELPDGPAAP